jgi:hypothetical protein
MRNDIKAIVCPDIHGRNFWEKAAQEYDGTIPFIFLGDYLDPYSDENITVEDAQINFNKIWEFKEKWGDNVILLLGNHDLSYKDYMFQCCRFSMYSSGWYKDFLNKHWEHFNLSYSIKSDDKTFIFSHAGIHPSWLKENNFEEIYDADYINSLFMTNKRAFTDYSVYRGGYLSAGSPVWADIREFSKVDLQDDKIMQVVGHTQLIKDKLEFKNICCIDSRQTFVITNDNKIEKYLVNDI